MTRWGRKGLLLALAVSLAATGCAGAGGGGGAAGGDANSISVLMVNNPQMVDLQQLAPRFTEQTGITVNFTVLPENELRDNVSQEFSRQAGQYDVATLSNFEIPIYAGNEWVAPMDDYIAADPAFDQADILGPMAESLTVDGRVYGQPFYGESSFLMYRRDVFEQAGITVSEQPTWQEVAGWAQQLDGVQPDMAGICLRGQPGWGQIFGPLTTVVNTFGGTWFTQDWQAQVDAPEFREATQFYVDLVTQYGQPGAAQSGFTECLNTMTQGGAAMWYDATSAAGSLEAADSPVRGLMGYAPAPVVQTDNSGWLYSWAWGIQQASQKKDAAWRFISWASSKEYEQLVGQELGWSRVPAGKRGSTYEIPEYVAEASAFAEPTRAAIEAADPSNPGVQPRPAPGIQFVGIPEFPALGTSVSEEVSSAIAGQITVDEALTRGQQLAEDVAAQYRQ
jgi:sorbitol/mannitol transport system substrate-binding protein